MPTTITNMYHRPTQLKLGLEDLKGLDEILRRQREEAERARVKAAAEERKKKMRAAAGASAAVGRTTAERGGGRAPGNLQNIDPLMRETPEGPRIHPNPTYHRIMREEN